jgi:putative transcriptional regulator
VGLSKPTALSNNIRSLRFAASEMTQQVLAERVGVTRQTIIAIEKGKYSPSLEVAFKIAGVFDSTVDAVFQYQPSIDPSTAAKLS